MRHLVILILIVFTSGCSRIEFTYRNADWLLEFYAKKTVAADTNQIEQWQPVLHDVLERHRVEMLPRLVTYLDILQRASQHPDNVMLTDCLVDVGVYLYQEHAQLAINLAVPLLMMIDSSQVNHLTEYTKKNQQKNRKKYLKTSHEKQNNARLTRFIRRIERWVGELTDAQLQELDLAIRKIPDLSQHWLDYRAKQTSGLLKILASQPDEQLVRNYLSGWWIGFEQRSVEYNQDWKIAKHEFTLLLQKIGSSLTERQHARLKQNIASIREDFASLHKPTHKMDTLEKMYECSI